MREREREERERVKKGSCDVFLSLHSRVFRYIFVSYSKIKNDDRVKLLYETYTKYHELFDDITHMVSHV